MKIKQNGDEFEIPDSINIKEECPACGSPYLDSNLLTDGMEDTEKIWSSVCEDCGFEFTLKERKIIVDIGFQADDNREYLVTEKGMEEL